MSASPVQSQNRFQYSSLNRASVKGHVDARELRVSRIGVHRFSPDSSVGAKDSEAVIALVEEEGESSGEE